MKTTMTIRAAAIVALLLTSCVSASAAPAAAATPTPATAPAATPVVKAPAATILFLDRAAVLRQSAVGKDMAVQVEALVKKMNADFDPENKKLQADVQAFQSQASVLTNEVRQAKIKDLEARRQAFQKKVQDRQASIQGGLAQARTKVEQALGPILEKLMVERGANLLLDRGLVVLGQNELDVTTPVIARLNMALPKVAIALVAGAAPPGGPPKPAAPAPGH
jgi:outer membrane protein